MPVQAAICRDRQAQHPTWQAQKNLATNLSRNKRLAILEPEHTELSLTLQAGLLGLSRSSLYYAPVGPSGKEIAIKHRIDEIYTVHPFCGSRRITACSDATKELPGSTGSL